MPASTSTTPHHTTSPHHTTPRFQQPTHAHRLSGTAFGHCRRRRQHCTARHSTQTPRLRLVVFTACTSLHTRFPAGHIQSCLLSHAASQRPLSALSSMSVSLLSGVCGEFDPQWEFDCPKWRDLRRADEADEADSWFGASDHSTSRDESSSAQTTGQRQRGASASRKRQQQHQRAASSSPSTSELVSPHRPPLPPLLRVKHKSDSVLCLSHSSTAHSLSHSSVYPVLPVRSVTPLTHPEPFKLSTQRRASRPALHAEVSQQTAALGHAQAQAQPRALSAASSHKENKRLQANSSQRSRPQSQSVKQRRGLVTSVPDVVSRLYTLKPQPLSVRTNRTESHFHTHTATASRSNAAKPTTVRAEVSGRARPFSHASVAASPASSPCPSPRPSPARSPASSPLSSARRITRPLPFRLASDVRAEQRRQWDAARSAESAEQSATAAAVDSGRLAAERRERRQQRQSLVHQPLPMPHFDAPFVPEKSKHSLTAPASPKLRTAQRASVGELTLSRRQQQPAAVAATRQRCSSRW